MPELERAVLIQVLPTDAADSRSVIMDIRAGTGGDEASLFAGELLRMYEQFCSARSWRFEVRLCMIIASVRQHFMIVEADMSCCWAFMWTCKARVHLLGTGLPSWVRKSRVNCHALR